MKRAPSASKKSLLERLNEKDGFVLCGEGYLFELEKRGYVQVGPFVPTVVLDHPEAVIELHREFMRCGSDIVEAFTYYGHREKLDLVGRSDQTETLNRKALEIAKQVAEEGGALFAGNISNSTIWADGNKEVIEKIKAQYREQVGWAKEAGVDFIIGETFDQLGEALAALSVIKEFDLVAVITMTFHQEDSARDGPSMVDCFKALKKAGADVVGINCHRGPNTLLPLLKQLREAIDGPIAALPVPLRTTDKKPTMRSLAQSTETIYTDLEPFYCTRYDMADFAKECMKIGVNYIGVCCGGKPYMVRSMAEALGRKVPASAFSPDMSKHFIFGNQKQFLSNDQNYAPKF